MKQTGVDISSCTGIADPSLTKLEYYVNIGIMCTKICVQLMGRLERKKKKKVFEVYFLNL